MAPARDKGLEQSIILGLLGAVERGSVTQRRLASELGIALGLVNAYVKRCVKKGYIKVKQVPAQRYGYYLTPKGFVEKSQLVASYFVYSFDFFRRARLSCKSSLLAAIEGGHRRIALVGASDLAEIVIIVATEVDIEIIAVVDQDFTASRFLNVPAKRNFSELERVDAVVITSVINPQGALQAATKEFGRARVLVPSVLADMIAAPVHPISKQRARQ